MIGTRNIDAHFVIEMGIAFLLSILLSQIDNKIRHFYTCICAMNQSYKKCVKKEDNSKKMRTLNMREISEKEGGKI